MEGPLVKKVDSKKKKQLVDADLFVLSEKAILKTKKQKRKKRKNRRAVP